MTEPAHRRDTSADFDPRDYRTALGTFGTGVTVITAGAPDGRRVGLTANSFSSVSLNPPLVLWNLSFHSPNLPVFQDASHFAVNVLDAHSIDLALRFARPASDKFAGVAVEEGRGGAPLLKRALARFQCRNAFRYYGGDHVIFLGAVEHYDHGPGEPLIFCRSAFGSFVPGG
jgi:flavin reductase (DIM6/NTAB) family NADH-FMN oxidoreductase RutF